MNSQILAAALSAASAAAIYPIKLNKEKENMNSLLLTAVAAALGGNPFLDFQGPEKQFELKEEYKTKELISANNKIEENKKKTEQEKIERARLKREKRQKKG